VGGNPLGDDEKRKRIMDITKRVMEKFSKNYLLAFKEVMVEDAKNNRKTEKIKHLQEEKRAEKPKPRRPRKKIDKKDSNKTPELKVKIEGYEEMERDYDPYIAYIIKSSCGNETKIVYRRFTQFKAIHKKVGKKVKGCSLPKTPLLGGREFGTDFIERRKKHFSEYLKLLVEDKNTSQNPEFRQWLGLDIKKDPIFEKTFNKAFKHTKIDLWIWVNIVYDDEGEGIAKLVLHEIKREMWHELISSLPSDPTLRKKTLEVVYKAVTNLITPVIQTGWNTAAKQVEDQKQFVKENVAKLLDTILSKEEELKAKMSEAVLKAIAPIKIEFSEKVSSLLQECGSPIVAIYSTIMEQRSIIYTEIEEALINNQPEKLDKVKHNVKELKDAVYNKLDSQIQGTIKNITGKDVNVSVKALASLFGPFKDLQHVIKSFFNFITPEHQFYVYKELLQHKKKIMDSPRADVESLLDREEYDTQWAIWWSHWSMYSDGWWFVWELSNYADLGSSRYALYQLAWDLVKISKKSLKKILYKIW